MIKNVEEKPPQRIPDFTYTDLEDGESCSAFQSHCSGFLERQTISIEACDESGMTPEST